jgi:ankyrin repeat protein
MTNHSGEIPLHLAARAGAINVVKLLVERWHGNMMDMSLAMNMPLHLAAAKGHINVVRLLAELCPESMRAKNNGDTPLHRTAAKGLTEVVRLLVECWPEGKEELNPHRQTTLSLFEKYELEKYELEFATVVDRDTVADKEEIIALLGGVF